MEYDPIRHSLSVKSVENCKTLVVQETVANYGFIRHLAVAKDDLFLTSGDDEVILVFLQFLTLEYSLLAIQTQFKASTD